VNTRTGGLARALVRAVARGLPTRSARARYRAEFLADLAALTTGAKLRYAVGVLVALAALRTAVPPDRTPDTWPLPRAQRPFRCRVLHRHAWRQAETSDGEPYRECARCGELHPRTQTMVGSTVPWTPSIT